MLAGNRGLAHGGLRLHSLTGAASMAGFYQAVWPSGAGVLLAASRPALWPVGAAFLVWESRFIRRQLAAALRLLRAHAGARAARGGRGCAGG